MPSYFFVESAIKNAIADPKYFFWKMSPKNRCASDPKHTYYKTTCFLQYVNQARGASPLGEFQKKEEENGEYATHDGC
jgi:hypothetical protein